MLKTTGIGRLATEVRFTKFTSGKQNAEFSVAFVIRMLKKIQRL